MPLHVSSTMCSSSGGQNCIIQHLVSRENLMLFIRVKAISGAPNINATNQFPYPPIMIGITIKKIITKAWAVTVTL